jgi:two-component system probable response regulator PhcQ
MIKSLTAEDDPMPEVSHLTTILLVDDEPNVSTALSRHFPKTQFEVLTAISAAEAFGILEQRTVEVIVSDERMPQQSGSEFLAAVRVRFPDTIRIILSGQATLEAAVRAINEGEVYRFFLKPCNPTDLLSTIRGALDHKRLQQRSRELLRDFRRQAALLATVEAHTPGLLRLQLDDRGAIVIDESEGDCDVADLLRDMEESMAKQRTHLGDCTR